MTSASTRLLPPCAQKELIESGLEFLAELDPNFRYEGAKVRVQSVITGSLGWDLLVEVYGNYQTQIEDRVVGSLEGMFGVDIPPEYEGIVTLAALAVTYMVARYAYERVARTNGSDKPSIYIRGENNVVIQQIAQTIGGDDELVARALERSLPPKKKQRLVRKVADFLRPSRKETGQYIELENAPDVPAEAIAEFPSDADLQSIDDSTLIDLVDALIDIRRLDRDNISTGWAAFIVNDERFPRRMPMDLYPTVDPELLARFPQVRANVVIEGELTPDKKLRPKRIHLLSFVEPEEESKPSKSEDS